MNKFMYYLFEKRFFDAGCDCERRCRCLIPVVPACVDIAFKLVWSLAWNTFWFALGFCIMWKVCERMLQIVGY